MSDRARIVATAEAAGARLRGVHAYEGHVATGTLAERCAVAHPIYEALVGLIGQVRDATGRAVAELVTSGTPSCVPALEYEGWGRLAELGTRHRVSPGTVVLHDARTMRTCPELALTPAAVVHAQVVSCPTDTVRTCNAGSRYLTRTKAKYGPNWRPARRNTSSKWSVRPFR